MTKKYDCSCLCVDHVEHELAHGVLRDEALDVVQDVLVQHQLHQVESTWGTICVQYYIRSLPFV